MFVLTERTSCAGCDVSVKPAAGKKMNALLKKLGGEVGDMSDKSIDLVFKTQADMDEFEKFGVSLGAIFD